MVNTEHILPLADKRQLCYLECGDSQGYPVLWCHGNPGSRLGWPLLLSRTGQVKARVLIPDRPGFGKSDPQPAQSYLAWPADIVQLVDSLDIEQFVVAGVSGGGPFALACAWQLSDRVAAVGLISTGPPVAEVLRQASLTNRLIFTLGRRAPHLVRLYSFMLSYLARSHPDRMIRQLLSGYAEADSTLSHRPDLQEFFCQYLKEAYAQGDVPRQTKSCGSLGRGISPYPRSLPPYTCGMGKRTTRSLHPLDVILLRDFPAVPRSSFQMPVISGSLTIFTKWLKRSSVR